MNDYNEKQCIKSIAEGNKKDFSTLFLRYYPRLKYFISGLLQNESVAEDLSQDIFVRIWQNRTQLCNIENFSSYLFKAAKNEVFHYIHHELLLKNYRETKQIQYSYKDFDNDLNIEEEIYAKELGLLIQATVDNMPSQRKKIFEMSRLQGKNNDEIAKELSINKRTVENHITQALSDIRKAINVFCFCII